ncbi:DUF177 domain-containing protein [Clostridium sp. 19966]|uniref:YceD family protein n=1 Tax=Clostridium sp. 19966 TaxID=2768166 RepID=UPI0028DF1CA9|nr:DUF177 domain-containing protein [Clostridium sp. 19966]MDT8716456.1 DUF177 domain-containing protein [Clostridium sp. 19966]
MFIYVDDIVKNKKVKKDLAFVIEPNDIFIENPEVSTLLPINFVGSLNLLSDIIYLDGNVTGSLKLVCSRCLEIFESPLNLEIHEKISLVPNNDDDTLVIVDSDKLNITEIIENDILISLPIKKLCSEDCKGLCPVCGGNKNHADCRCESAEIDPRLAKLKDLFFSE